MSNPRYLEISSAYRNRKIWPHQAEFDVEISSSGTKNYLNALDPVSNAATELIFSGSFRADTASVSITITAVISATTATQLSGITEMTIQATAGQLRTADDFYIGAILALTNGGTTARRRILTYRLISNTTAFITVNSGFPDALIVAGTTGLISNPTDFTLTINPIIFLPSSSFIDNYYAETMLYNVDVGESVRISSYEGTTHTAYLETVPVGWTATDHFIVHRSKYESTGLLQGVNGNYVSLDPLTANSADTSYTNSFVLLLNTPPSAAISPPAPYGEQRRIVQYVAYTGEFVDVTGTSFTFPLSASPIDNYYTGMFFSTGGVVYRIVSYVGATRSGVASGAIAAVTGDTFYIRTAILEASPSLTDPVVGDTYQIELFSSDNAVPFTYSGSVVSQQQTSCYKIELIDLSLPNRTLRAGRGGRIAFYPYVYVQLENANSSVSPGIIYSNNPNANKMLFKATIDDIPNPFLSPFVKINGDGMLQTVKFKPNDSIRFSVHLPSGELFKTESELEYFSPSAPNPLTQITALFSLEKL